MAKLSNFEGSEVITARITITKAGDGLSEPLDLRPVELHTGEEVFVLLRGEVAEVRHKGVKGTDAMARVHVVATNLATLVDGETGAAILASIEADLAEKREADERAAEASAGIQRIWDEDDEDDDGPVSPGLSVVHDDWDEEGDEDE